MRTGQSGYVCLPWKRQGLFRDYANLCEQYNKEQRGVEVSKDKQGEQGLPIADSVGVRRSVDFTGDWLWIIGGILDGKGVWPEVAVERV